MPKDLRSSEPYWLVRSGLLHAYPSLQQDLTCDVLIVGGGITGALLFHALLEASFDCVLVDRRDIASGSTAASTAMLQYEVDTPLFRLREMIGQQDADLAYRGCRDAIYDLEQTIATHGIDCGFERKRSLYFAHNRRAARWLETEHRAREDAGFEVAWLEEDEIKSRFGLKSEAAILSEDGATVDAYRCAKHLIQHCALRGACVHDKTECVSFEENPREVVATTRDGARIVARHVVHCTGYESTETLNVRVVNLFSTFALATEQDLTLPREWRETMLWNTADPYLYMRTTDEGRLVLGGRDLPFKNERARDKVIPRQIDRILKDYRVFCDGPELRLDYTWAGTFGATKDGLPYIGKAPKQERTYYNLGFGGNGILFSVLGAQIIPQLLQGQTPELAHCFRFGR